MPCSQFCGFIFFCNDVCSFSLSLSLSLSGLSTVLRNTAEHEMVRHEAAEALGSIGGPEIETLLEQFQGDSAQLVAQSCQVALQINDYWKEFSVGASSTSQTTDEVVT